MQIGSTGKQLIIRSIITILVANGLLIASIVIQPYFSKTFVQINLWEIVRNLLTLNIALIVALGFPLRPVRYELEPIPYVGAVNTKATATLRTICLNFGRTITLQYSIGTPNIEKVTDITSGTCIIDEDPFLRIPSSYTTNGYLMLKPDERREIEIPLFIESVPRTKCYVEGNIPVQIRCRPSFATKSKPLSLTIPFRLNIEEVQQ